MQLPFILKANQFKPHLYSSKNLTTKYFITKMWILTKVIIQENVLVEKSWGVIREKMKCYFCVFCVSGLFLAYAYGRVFNFYISCLYICLVFLVFIFFFCFSKLAGPCNYLLFFFLSFRLILISVSIFFF